MTSTVIVVPWRDKGDPWRRTNLEAVLHHLDQADIAPVLRTSDGREGDAPFNRSAAYNRGVRRNKADVYVFHEADMIVPASQLRAAIDIAAETPGLVVPFSTYRYLSKADTEAVHNGASPYDKDPEYEMANGRSIGAVNVVSAATMAAVGQWDETFEGWGFDDRAMCHAFHVATGRATRHVLGAGTHLWHTPGWSLDSRFRGGSDIPAYEKAATEANEKRYHQYRCARTAAQIQDLTAGRR